ncbi:MAG: ABC transporter substrate-binding protein [Ignisphaera sp.]
MLNAFRISIVMAILAILVVASILVYSYINRSSIAKEAENYIAVEDFAGRVVKVPRDVRRIVALGPGMLRLISYLNSLDLVVGTEEVEHTWTTPGRDYAMAYGELFRGLPIVGTGGPRNPPDPEKIRIAKPDLVVMFLGYTALYDPDRLSEEVGAPVIAVDYSPAGYVELEPVKKALRLLGKVLGREARAEEICKFIDSVISDLTLRVKDIDSKPIVYVGAVSYAGKRPFTASQAGFPPLLLLNTNSIADEVSQKHGFVELDFEYLLQKQPDVIFIDLNNLDVVLDDFAKDKVKYCSLKAFRDGKVYSILPFNYYHTNIATALADTYYIGKVLYPEKFTDIDPVAKADEIFMAFLGKGLYEEFVKGFGRGFGQLGDLFNCG